MDLVRYGASAHACGRNTVLCRTGLPLHKLSIIYKGNKDIREHKSILLVQIGFFVVVKLCMGVGTAAAGEHAHRQEQLFLKLLGRKYHRRVMPSGSAGRRTLPPPQTHKEPKRVTIQYSTVLSTERVLSALFMPPYRFYRLVKLGCSGVCSLVVFPVLLVLLHARERIVFVSVHIAPHRPHAAVLYRGRPCVAALICCVIVVPVSLVVVRFVGSFIA